MIKDGKGAMMVAAARFRCILTSLRMTERDVCAIILSTIVWVALWRCFAPVITAVTISMSRLYLD